MQKALLATTALVLSAGVAAADVTISGYGRTGIIYYEDDTPGAKETQVISRLRMNIDATTETDAGVEFGGRLRLQWDQNANSHGAIDDLGLPDDLSANRDALRTQAGKLWISAQGLTVEIGNVDTAIDNSGLIYATELGAFDRSVGFSDVTGDFFAYTDSYSRVGRVGVAAIYSFGDVAVRASFINPDQTTDLVDVDDPAEGEWEKEIGLAVDYTWNDRLELSAALTQNGAGFDGNDIYFVGARYAVLDNARIGLNYVSTNDADDADYASVGNTVALYGDYTLADGLTNIEAYVANNDADWVGKETDNAFGIGVNYDLGGARLGASIQRDYEELVTADMGVRFNF